jgi:NAD(P)-dependent dehydrogenase (short-subunit alcohol dehydrogenase family)
MMRAERRFTMDDQMRFAALSGDRNPMHLDALAARRTAAGVPVVHGIHDVLWCLDAIAAALGPLAAVASLRVNFDSFVSVSEPVEAVVLKHDANILRAEVRAGSTPVMALALGFGAPQAAAPSIAEGEPFDGAEPIELTLEDMTDRAGRVKLAAPVADIAAAFPHAAQLLGPIRVAGLGAMTRLVGMVCPGLHSIFNGIALKTCAIADDSDATIGYRVSRLDPRYRRLVHDIAGCGWTGTVTCSARHPPTPQASMASLAGTVAPDAFSGQTALVVGGSRGLGELTAKLIATGGGRVIVTYAAGRADADRLVHEIAGAGGAASALHYDVLGDPGPQLALLQAAPTHLYYFATPAITGRRSAAFNHERFARFTDFYVTGFIRLVEALRALTPDGLSVLYPSTVAVTERPAGMTEYAMAKAAGELLCEDLATYQQDIRIRTVRLPRLATDQTATLQNVETGDPIAALLPDILALHGG